MLDYEKAISIAEQKCLQGGVRFYPTKKTSIVGVDEADAALSAYEIAEQCNADSEGMSAFISAYCFSLSLSAFSH